MADSSFGLKIGLEGEREFKRAITEINREMRVLGSEMKLAASAFAKNETSAASLTAKNQVLAKEIDAQRSKVETLRAALDNAATSFGENDSRTKNWQIQLNNAQATLNGLEQELEDNNDALKQFADHADDAGDDAKDAASQTGRLEDAVDDLGGELDDTSGKTRIFGDVLKANLAEVPATQPAAKPESDPMRPRPRRAALGPVPGFGEKWLRTEPLRGPAMSKTHA